MSVLEQVASYPAVFMLCVSSGTLVPMPEDVPLLYAGMQISLGHLDPVQTALVAIAGVFLRDLILYGIGYGFGRAVLERPLVRRFFGAGRLDRAVDMVARRAGHAVLIGRFMVGVRGAVFLVSGACGLPPAQFMLWDMLGMVVAVPLALLIGYFFGKPAVDFLLWLIEINAMGWVVAALVVGAAAVWGVRTLRAGSSEGEPS